MPIIERFRSTGERYVPHRARDGQFRVADPTLGDAKKKAENQIAVPTILDVISFLQRGFHLRMRGENSGQVNLICPDQIIVR
jgi:hypothetical protein